ncbi:hypothetical protein LTR91_003068 [Friedmanniomyces endolithicus]|uniref:Uncharacterized protein n=1 Tax=Friedmanniomyces endolithicus TaxID=329885 RepID=A0AAN6KX04_9PEZI|nr:hypothetical protein LTR57_003013 [Friedmanniomyces endolithicus]KAK1008709.1 hypothetical protein LTR91_003068 [Friedmanniomyces endolithicus]KAK1012191.1 hypothetical protein LTS01_000969 [Friedmanniomyces endolithicus]KAK1042073.1 hypothetical protein LTS16_009034 [Friedmanniomyces endolithicus]
MFAKVRNKHERGTSSITAVPPSLSHIPAPTKTIPPPLVSPLQMTFDFELDPPTTSSLSVDSFRPSSESISRPRTSDGVGPGALGNGKSMVGLQPPILPPIPRIASRQQSVASSLSQPSEAAGEAGLGARHESDNVSALSAGSRKSTGIRLMPSRSFEQVVHSLPASRSFEHPIDLLPTSRTFQSRPAELLPTSGPLGVPTGLGFDGRSLRSGDSTNTTPRMQASIFPTRVESKTPVLPLINGGPAMTREFIDSRDKSYSHPSARLSSIGRPAEVRPAPMQNSQSMPFLSAVSSPGAPPPHSQMSSPSFQQATSSNMPLVHSPGALSVQTSPPMLPSLQTPSSFSSFYSQSPVSPYLPTPTSATSMSLRAPKISGARLSPNSSVEDLRLLPRSPTNGTAPTRTYTLSDAPLDDLPLVATTKSGKSTTRNGAHANRTHPAPAQSPLATIGTPYQETSSSFPLPQHVSVRPKTSSGDVSTMGGVKVPTHHTSAKQRPESVSTTAKPDRRKTRLLNPIALLSRRKSSQESEEIIAERSAAAQAYMRQRSVAAAGVNKMPADFDPRIKGNKVHDFSAPRPARRNLSYNDADPHSPAARQILTPHSPPSIPFLQYDPHHEQPPPSSHSKTTSDSSSARKSVHSPIFREHLTEDPGDPAKRISSLNAERLENKEFLQRVSHHSSNSGFSQESSVLPPFARRSQVLDPMQASLAAHDEEGEEEESGAINRSSDPVPPSLRSSGRVAAGRESKTSSFGAGEGGENVSPITSTARSSAAQHVELPIRSSPHQSLSPVSPNTPDAAFRPISAVYNLPPAASAVSVQSAPTSPQRRRDRTASEATARPFSAGAQALLSSLSGDAANIPLSLPVQRVQNPYLAPASAPSPIMPLIPQRTSSQPPDPHLSLPYLPLPGRTSDLPTPELTPEIGTADSIHFPSTMNRVAVVQQQAPQHQPPRVVERRVSAAGHAARRVSTTKARHRVSNASRFSFQFDEGREEEKALEEKGRLIGRGEGGGDGEEEEEFDEGAMDDLDELEVREREEQVEDSGVGSGVSGAKAAGLGVLSMAGARRALQAEDSDDDDGSVYDDEEEEGPDDDDEVPSLGHDERRLRHLTWAEHPAMRAHSALASHSRDASQATVSNANNYAHKHNQSDDLIDQYMHHPQHQQQQQQQHTRDPSTASALALDTTTAGADSSALDQYTYPSHASMPNGVDGARPSSGFSAWPHAAGHSAYTSSPLLSGVGAPLASVLPPRPMLPHRDSGNSERNRVGSGMSFGSASASAGAGASRGVGVRGAGVEEEVEDGGVAGLGLSGLGDFQFGEGPDMTLTASRPTSYETGGGVGNGNARVGRGFRDSETIPRSSAGWAEMRDGGTPLANGRASSYFPSSSSLEQSRGTNAQSAAYRGSIGKSLRQRNERVDQNRQYADTDSEIDDDGLEDDMYYDDGGFDPDIRNSRQARRGGSMDEDDFDDPAFLGGANRTGGQVGRQRHTSMIPFDGLGGGISGGDGPYPSFAMGANPVKARARQSQMLLEDLPLTGAMDPKLIPQRNPSEDAKRLGLSSKVPPLPPQPGPGSAEAMAQMQVKMQAYHASIAEALNKAAAEGRFARQLSISTARTGSGRSAAVGPALGVQGEEEEGRDDRSHYSRDESGAADGLAVPNRGTGDDAMLGRSISNITSGSKMAHSLTYTPPKMSFDFGFEDLLTNDARISDNVPITDDLDADYDDLDDDDIVAAANAEALASDDSGFYGQEFGFYAHARPESGDLTAINGGFFGEDGGDDGLTRSKSWKEPNMTPISERTEFSTRNSFINLGHGPAMFGPPSAGGYGAVAPMALAATRLPRSPLAEHGGEVASFEQLRKLRADAWGGSNGSLQSEHSSVGGKAAAVKSAAAATAATQGYFGTYVGGSPKMAGQSADSSGSNSYSASAGVPYGYGAGKGGNLALSTQFDSSPQQQQQQRYGLRESPLSATTGGAPGAKAFQFPVRDESQMPTPRKSSQPTPQAVGELAPAARTFPAAAAQTHSRKGSDSVTYVREQDPVGGGQPRWVLERRRTSEQGKLELVGREVVQGGWI